MNGSSKMGFLKAQIQNVAQVVSKTLIPQPPNPPNLNPQHLHQNQRRRIHKMWGAAGGKLKSAAKASTAWRPFHTIQATPRELTGSRLAAKERALGRIPGVVLAPHDNGGTPKCIISTEKEQIQSIIETVQVPFFCSTTFPLEIRAGSGSSTLVQSGNVRPIKVHRDPETGKVLNLVFVWANKGTALKVDVPIVFNGEESCLGVTKGGYINKIRSSLKYLCPCEHIPSKIEVDVSNLDIGDLVSIHDVQVHPSLKLLSKNETMPVCKILAIETSKQS